MSDGGKLKRQMELSNSGPRKTPPPAFVELLSAGAASLPDYSIELEGRNGKLCIRCSGSTAAGLAGMAASCSSCRRNTCRQNFAQAQVEKAVDSTVFNSHPAKLGNFDHRELYWLSGRENRLCFAADVQHQGAHVAEHAFGRLRLPDELGYLVWL